MIKKELSYIYKIESKDLRKAKWNLDMPLTQAMREYPDNIVSLGSSQLIRFINEINGVEDISGKVKEIRKLIRQEKKKEKNNQSKKIITRLYEELYELEFQKDYICVVMNNSKDYDRANKGFTINGIKFKRFLGTNGGIKNSTIVYVNEELYPELKKRMDNGRNIEVELVPAKLEAYQALICSGSIPLPKPEGIIVINDCITFFKDDVIMINDEEPGEPVMTEIDGYEIEHNNSDGCGMMTPAYSRKVNGYLTGDKDNTISGMNIRYAWTKGMIYTFDFIEFAEKIAGTYEIVDAWGCKRDVRNAEVILTVSMLKLWDSYDSWEDYYRNCEENHYQFSASKVTPKELENVRDTNYQFLQSYELTEDELKELCQPTINELLDVMGMDYRKSLTFLTGFGLTDDFNFNDNYDDCVKALMIDKRMINDPYIRKKIYNMIKKRIEMAERGAIRINANFAMISGDLFALCQSMFGLKITGLLQTGEIYHRYWDDKGSEEVVCFRAPMTCANNIRKLRLCKTKSAQHWFQYINSAIILNSWDTTCEAMNGADMDGDTFMCTNNPILLKKTKALKTIICVQKRAAKKIVSEEDIIAANKLAFNNDIGIVTNHITSMFEVQAGFEKGSREYETLAYRIMCGQAYQQQTIDRAKGIICKPMPSYWYSMRDNKIEDGDSPEVIEMKTFNQKIVAYRKPYFMIHVYPSFKKQYKTYIDSNNNDTLRKFGKYSIYNIDDLENYSSKNYDMMVFLKYFKEFMPSGNNGCVVNRIANICENAFDNFLSKTLPEVEFDYSILKCGIKYSKNMFGEINKLYKEYQRNLEVLKERMRTEKIKKDYYIQEKKLFDDYFEMLSYSICPNEEELCEIMIDVCYKKNGTKQFAWDVCSDRILKNLFIKNNFSFSYPVVVKEFEEYEFNGIKMIMKNKIFEEMLNDYIK